MPYHFYHLAEKEAFPPEQVVQRDRVVTRHFLGDVRHLLSVFFSRDKMRRYTYPSRFTALKAFFQTPSGTLSDVWSWRDPKPAFYEGIDMIKKLWK